MLLTSDIAPLIESLPPTSQTTGVVGQMQSRSVSAAGAELPSRGLLQQVIRAPSEGPLTLRLKLKMSAGSLACRPAVKLFAVGERGLKVIGSP